jgi:hypothetical protein
LFTAPMVRLVPSSGIQFLDLKLNSDGLSRTIGQFAEDHIEAADGTRTVLIDVGRDAGHDGVVWHPLTKRPLGPEEFLTVSGFAGLEPFLDTWMPLPYLRFRARSPSGQISHDPGPANWVRAFVATPKNGLRSAKTLDVVLAFDTKLAPVYGTGEAPDVGPSAYDALFGSTFQMNDKLADIGMFVSEPWVDGWLKSSFAEFVRRSADVISDDSSNDGRFQLEHVARYLTYLAVITRGTMLPQVRFADSFSNAWQMPVTGVDLVLDIAAEKTGALLVMRDATPGATANAEAVLAGAAPLMLRDLNNPVLLHTGPPSTTVEFDAHNFGNPVASRRSGRTEAFQWPSLVRVGSEAERLALRVSATPGVTGRHNLFSGLNEIAIADGVWRFSRDDAAGVDQGPIVAGEVLSYLTEDGTVIGRFDKTGVPAIRPRFSESSLLGLYVGELLMHAMVQINRPDFAAALAATLGTVADAPASTSAGPVRQLQRILVTVATAISDEDRRLLQTRIEGAIDLIWKAMQWDDATGVASPPKPQVSLGIGSDVAAQLVYVFDEVKGRFGGDATEYLHVLRRPVIERPGTVFRIARFDFEAASTGLTILDYDVANDGNLRPTIVDADRSAFGRDSVLAAFANSEVWPAIVDHVQTAGIADAAAFMSGLMADAGARRPGQNPAGPAHFARRFDGKIIRPAAESCLRSCEAASSRVVDTTWMFTFQALVQRGGGRLDGLAQHFNAAAAAAGAVDFRLEDVKLRVRQRRLAGLIRQALDPMLTRFCDAIINQSCDLVLLEGRLARLPDVSDELRRRLGLPAHCIVDVAAHAQSTTLATALPATPATALATTPATARDAADRNPERPAGAIGAIGAYLASQQAFRTGNFRLVTTDMAASLQQYRPVAVSQASTRPARQAVDAYASPDRADALPPMPLAAAVNSGLSLSAALSGPADIDSWTQGTLVRVAGTKTGQDLVPLAATDGAPRRRYAGEREL